MKKLIHSLTDKQYRTLINYASFTDRNNAVDIVHDVIMECNDYNEALKRIHTAKATYIPEGFYDFTSFISDNVCKACNQIYPSSFFRVKKNKGKAYLCNECRNCERERYRKWRSRPENKKKRRDYENLPERIQQRKEYQRMYYLKNKKIMTENKQNEFAKLFWIDGYQVLIMKDFKSSENEDDNDIEQVCVITHLDFMKAEFNVSFNNENARDKYFDKINDHVARQLFENALKLLQPDL